MDSDYKRKCSKIGLSLITAAHLDPDGPSTEFRDIIRRGLDDDLQGFEANAIIGLSNVATGLLVKLEKATGVPYTEHLRDIGQQIEGPAA